MIEILGISRRLTQMTADTASANGDFLYGELTEIIIGVFYDVYNELGCGFLESVYQRAMEIALTDAGLNVRREACLEVTFRDRISADLR